MAYKDFGYLSPSLAAFSPPATKEYMEACSLVEEQFSIAERLLRNYLELKPQDKTVHVGYCCWLRALECFKATVALAKMGLDSAQHAPFRAGLEWLFWACAYWKDTSVVEKFQLNDDFEESKHATLLSNEPGVILGAEEIKLLEKAKARDTTKTGYSIFNVAETAQLMTEYQMYYRMSSRAGAHATMFACLELWKKNPQGKSYIAHGPDHEMAWLMIQTVAEMVQVGNQRFQEHAEAISP
jgi:hypothetical protein